MKVIRERWYRNLGGDSNDSNRFKRSGALRVAYSGGGGTPLEKSKFAPRLLVPFSKSAGVCGRVISPLK